MFRALLLVASLCLPTTYAFIAPYGDDNDRRWASKPDYKVGERLDKRFKYPAHLQYVPKDVTLCGPGPYNVTKPVNNIPIALVLKDGGCSIAQKALAASTLIYPEGVVKFIIVDGDRSIRDGGWMTVAPSFEMDDTDLEPLKILNIDQNNRGVDATDDAEPNAVSDDLASINGDAEVDDDQDQIQPNDDESVMTTARVLRRRSRKKDPNIRVTVLRVSYRVGNELFGVITHQDVRDRKAGGTLVYVDAREPPASARTVLLWILMSACISAGACCCLLLCLSRGLWDDPPPAAPQRPVRRRLTHMQVRANYPYYLYSDGDHNPDDGHLHECSICLDEFENGVRMRRLPCEHEFHATCIARWLIERSATCPLCKVDLYEEEDDDDDSESESASPGRSQLSMSQWISGFLLGPSASGPQVSPLITVAASTTAASGSAGVEGAALTGASPSTPPEATDQTSRPWWQFGRLSTTETTGTAQPTAAAAVSSSWWPFSLSGDNISVAGDAESTNGDLRRRWFWQRPHRGSRQALTELTEPLLVSVESDAEGAGPPAELQPSPEEAPSSTQMATLPADSPVAADPPPTPPASDEIVPEV